MVQPILNSDQKAYNPYPSLGAPIESCWPRGFPINLVQKSWNQQLTPVKNDGKFGVLQSLADFQPDVDALYRLTQKTPFVFQRPPIRKLNGNDKDSNRNRKIRTTFFIDFWFQIPSKKCTALGSHHLRLHLCCLCCLCSYWNHFWNHRCI